MENKIKVKNKFEKNKAGQKGRLALYNSFIPFIILNKSSNNDIEK